LKSNHSRLSITHSFSSQSFIGPVNILDTSDRIAGATSTLQSSGNLILVAQVKIVTPVSGASVAEDRDAEAPLHGAEADPSTENLRFAAVTTLAREIKPTRRGILVGGATLAMAGSAHADDYPAVDVKYEDASRRALLITYTRRTKNDVETKELRLAAASFGEPDPSSFAKAARFVRARTATGWVAYISNAAFPGGPTFKFEIEIGWDPTAKAEIRAAKSTLSLRLIGAFRGGPVVLSTGSECAANLEQFLFSEPPAPPETWSTRKDELSGKLEKTTEELVSALFGPSLGVGTAKQVRLCFSREGHWHLQAGSGSFAALPSEGVKAACNSIAFAVLTDRTGTGSDRKTSKVFEVADVYGKAAEDVRVLFEGQGAPPTPKAPKGADLVSAPRALYALAKLTQFSGSLSFGQAPRPKSNSTPSTKLSLTSDPEDGRDALVAWRNVGDGRPVLALRAGMAAHVECTERGARPAHIPALRGLIWRVPGEDAVVRLAAALEPMRECRIDTRFGPFTVGPLPTMSERPKSRAAVPAVRIAAAGANAADRTLAQFAAPFALKAASVALDRSDVSSRESFTTLDFDQTECLFRLDEVRLGHSWTGQSLPATDPPQAEAIIHLGTLPARGPAVRISLSRAHLAIRRPRDLLSLNYRFQDLVLERDGAEWEEPRRRAKGAMARWWVVPDRRLAAFAAIHPTSSPPAVPPLCDDPQPAATSIGRYETVEDPRPRMVVEFPPQHIAEQSFFRQFKATPRLPEVVVGKHLTRQEDTILRGWAPEDLGDGGSSENPSRRADRLAKAFEERVKLRTDICNRNINEELHLEYTAPGDQLQVWRRALAGHIADDEKAIDAFADFHRVYPFTAFAAAFSRFAEKENLPKDQCIYIGPTYLDPVAGRIARRIASKIDETNARIPPNTPAEREYQLRGLPEIDLQPGEVSDLLFQLGITKLSSETADWNENTKGVKGADDKPIDSKVIVTFLERRERLKIQRDYDYASFHEFYNRPLAQRLEYQKDGEKNADMRAGAARPKLYPGRVGYIKFISQSGEGQTAAFKDIVANVDAYNQFAAKLNEEPFKIPAEARVSGRSRLAFRIPADDYGAGRPGTDGRTPGAFPFTAGALTNWGAFDLAVVRRAEKVFDPLPGGRVARRWDRNETRDEAERLVYQGLTRGGAWARREREGRIQVKDGCVLPQLNEPASSRITGAERMAEIAAGSQKPPRWNQTSIEIPFRLMLSPAQDAIWRTPLHVPEIGSMTTDTGRPVPLWFARLEEPSGASSLRAIWSPDYRPEALLDPELDPEVGSPPRGPWAPWALPPNKTSRQGYTEAERQLIERFRAPMDAYDRHELVMLSSLYGLPVRGRRAEDGSLVGNSQLNPPSGFELRDVVRETLKEGEPPADWSAIYKPQPIGASELTLTALGGTFEADTNFVPPASARMKGTLRDGPRSLYDALSIERWRQSTILGRDIKVEVVYRGFLFPLGHRASLVKLTERRFMAQSKGSPPVAFLVQRMFLRVGLPEKKYPAIRQPNRGRRWPVEKLEILTRETPDLVDPTDALDPQGKDTQETRNGRIFLRENGSASRPGIVFWPRVFPRSGGEVRFEMQLDGRSARVRLPLIFVDNTAANDIRGMELLAKYYNTLLDGSGPDTRRILDHSGFKRRYAAEDEPDGTSFETLRWVIEAEGTENRPPEILPDRHFRFANANYDFSALHQGADQPPFYPAMQEGRIRIAQVDRMLGGITSPIDVRFDPEYQAFGFPQSAELGNPNTGKPDTAWTDVYLDFMSEVALDPREAGDRIGGAARPNAKLVALSRSRGPVAGTVISQQTAAAAGTGPAAAPGASAATPSQQTGVPSLSGQFSAPKVEQFFDLDAKILGILSFKEALKFIGAGIASTPAFKEVTQYASSILAQAGDREKQLEKDSGAIIAKVRDALLVPLRDALTVLAKEWDAGKIAAGAAFDEDQAVKRLTSLYPDVGRAFKDMQDALDQAIRASTSVRDVEDLFRHFSAIYASGRRFVTAIERVAADPIAPVRAALRDLFQSRIAALLGELGSVGQAVHDGLDELAKAAKARIKNFVAGAGLAVWRRLIFSLPVAQSKADKVRAAVEDALVQTLQGDAWLDALTGGFSVETALAAAARTIESGIRNNLGNKANDAIRTEINQALADWDAIQQAEKRIQGYLFVPVLTAIRQIDGAVAGLAKDRATIEVEAVRSKLQAVVQSAVELARPALDDLQLEAHTLCQNSLLVLKTVLSSAAVRSSGAITTAGQLGGALAGAVTALDRLHADVEIYRSAAAKDGKAADLENDLASLKSRIASARQTVELARGETMKTVGALDRIARQFEALAASDLSDKVCKTLDPGDLDRLPLETLSALANARDIAVGALVKLANALRSVESPFGDTASSILAVLRANQDDLKTGWIGAKAASAKAAIAEIAAKILPGVEPADPLRPERIYAVQAVRGAVQAVSLLLKNTTQFAQEATLLKGGEQQIKDLNTAAAALHADLDKINKVAAAELKKVIDGVDNQRTTYTKKIADVVAGTEKTIKDAEEHLQQSITDLRSRSKEALDAITGVATDVVEATERGLMDTAARRLSAGQQTAGAIARSAFEIVRPALTALAVVQAKAVANRDLVLAQLPNDGAADTGSDIGEILKNMAKATVADLRRLLLVPRPAAARKPLWSGEDPDPKDPARDYLTAERDQLDALSRKNREAYSAKDAADLVALFGDWNAGRSSAEQLIDRLKRAGERILSGDLARVVDLEGARRRIESKLREMIPSKVALNYDLAAEMKDFPPSGRRLFVPQGDKRLTIAAGASYDLLNPSNPPVFTALATISPFEIDLFDVVTLMFDGARFSNDSRKGSDFKLAYRDFKLGSKAEFIKPLESVLNPKGSGPYVRPMRGSPGIEAGYSLDIGIVSIGTLSFTNVSLNAACRLPFDNRQAIFSVSIGRRDKPFLISALPYTGGGFLGLLANSKSIVGFEASFEFGGGGAFKFGLLEGQGRLCVGIYVNQINEPSGAQGATIEGFFYAGGEAHVACFGVSTTLVVRIGQQPGGSMHGSAVFTFSFSLGFTDITFKIGVEKNEGKGFSGNRNAVLPTLGKTRFAQSGSSSLRIPFTPGALIASHAVSQSVDWNRYQSYFTADIDGFAA
jgi:hypothetical protein